MLLNHNKISCIKLVLLYLQFKLLPDLRFIVQLILRGHKTGQLFIYFTYTMKLNFSVNSICFILL